MAIRRAAWNGWKAVAHEIGDFQSRLLLTTFYFTIFAPFALVTRLLGDPLHLRRPAGTAWRDRQATANGIEDARRQS